MKKNFDKKIKQKIDQAEISPSAGLWDKIEAQLPKEEQKKGFFLLPLFGSPLFKQAIAASVMFLLGGMTVYYILDQDKTAQYLVEQNGNNINTSKNTASTSTKNLIEDEKEKNKDFTNHFRQKNTTSETKTTITNNDVPQHSNFSKSIYSNNINNKNSTTKISTKNTTKKAYSNPLIKLNNGAEETTSKNMNASDYAWIYDESTGAYEVVLKTNKTEIKTSNLLENSLFAQEENTNKDQVEDLPSYMSLIEKKEAKKLEVLEKTEDEPVLKAFNSKNKRLNYKGFWLGPQLGFEGVFVGKSFYAGGSFGVDAGYDFGTWGIQSGLKYALNSKTIQITADGSLQDYKSEFNSLHLPLYARYKFTSIKNSKLNARPISLNLIGGFDYAYVDRKKLHQLGLNLGVEYDIFTQADLMITIGAKGGVYNNLNLYELDFKENISRYNYLLNTYISVRFIDWAKKK